MLFIIRELIGCIRFDFVYMVIKLVNGLLWIKFGLLCLIINVIMVLSIMVIRLLIVISLEILFRVWVDIMLKLN